MEGPGFRKSLKLTSPERQQQRLSCQCLARAPAAALPARSWPQRGKPEAVALSVPRYYWAKISCAVPHPV